MDGLSAHSRPVVLLAVYDEDFALFSELALQDAGFTGRLEIVHSLQGLLDYLQDKDRPDLIMLDLGLNPTDLCEALHTLGLERNCKGIPIVVMTGYSGLEEMAIREGYRSCSYVEKPSDFRIWRAVMEDVIRTHLSGQGKKD